MGSLANYENKEEIPFDCLKKEQKIIWQNNIH